MKLHQFFLLVFILSFSNSLFSQNCEDLSQWSEVLKNEYPEITKTRIRVKKHIKENIRANLYSDKYFIPFSGKSVLDVSRKRRISSWQKIKGCYGKNKFKTDPYLTWVSENILYTLQSSAFEEEFGNKVSNINKVRTELSGLISFIKANDVGYNDFNNYKIQLENKFSILFPSEREVLQKLIDEKQNIAADRLLKNKVDDLLSTKKGLSSIDTLERFEEVNKALFESSSLAVSSDTRNRIRKRIEKIFDPIKLAESQKIDEISNDYSSLTEINRYIVNFKKVYGKGNNLNYLQQLREKILDKKTKIVLDGKEDISHNIQNAARAKDLDYILSVNFSDVKKNNSYIMALKNLLEDKRISLANAELMKKNPSGVTLSFDGKRRGNRNRGTQALYGEEAAGKIREMNNYILNALNSDPNIIVINWKSYIINMFYGNFDKLKPSLTNKGIFGTSGDYFPEFHNGFLYYVHQQYGDSYYPNLTYKDFKIITTRTRKDGTGMIVNQSQIPTPYRIYLPKLFKDKFEQYLDKDQFSWSGEQFNLEMEYLILDFLSQYDPKSDAFKQLMNNIYRYSKKMDPVIKKEELVEL